MFTALRNLNSGSTIRCYTREDWLATLIVERVDMSMQRIAREKHVLCWQIIFIAEHYLAGRSYLLQANTLLCDSIIMQVYREVGFL